MSEACKVIATLTVDSVALMGKNEVLPVYVCVTSATYFPPSAPYVCPAATAVHLTGKWLQNPSAKGLVTKAGQWGCDIVVEFSASGTRTILVEGKSTVESIRRAASNAAINLRAATSTEGIVRLMNAMARP